MVDYADLSYRRKVNAPIRRTAFVLLVALLMLVIAACAAPADPSPTAARGIATPTAASSPTPGTPPATARSGGSSASASSHIRYSLMPDGSEARYRVREQLVERNLPSDAVGVTTAISGTIVLEPNGTIVSEESKFIADLRNLRSDRDLRDSFIKRSTLQTDRYPTAEFVPTEARGLPSPLPTAGEVQFQLLGSLTVHGVTKPTAWQVVAQVLDQDIKGSAKTSFKFEDFGMTPPRVAAVLSVENNIVLEFDFHLRRQSSTP